MTTLTDARARARSRCVGRPAVLRHRGLASRPPCGSAPAQRGAGVLATAIGTAVTVATGRAAAPRSAGCCAVDALSAFMLIVDRRGRDRGDRAATPAHLRAETRRRTGPTARIRTQHSILVQLFLAAMALAVLAANLGVLWVAIEATTVVTAFLVGQRRGRGAVEAAWKYVVICSVGIALALLGHVPAELRRRHAPAPDRAGLGRPDRDAAPAWTRA